MPQLGRLLSRHLDFPLLKGVRVPAAAAGSAADYEAVIWATPNLALLPGASAGLLPSNVVGIRSILLIPEAPLVGNATNYFTWAVRQWRAGSVINQVNTTGPTITAGTQTVLPASMAGIQVGSLLVIAGGTGATETVQVTAIGASGFTAVFANGHSGAYTITSSNLASVIYNAPGVTESTLVPHQLNPALVAPIKGGDVLTLQRVSNNVTGLASPAVTVLLDYLSVLNNVLLG